jgi:hypothetical protein
MRESAALAFEKGASHMNPYSEIMRALGRIEGELVKIRKLSERVSSLEHWHSWLKGGLAAMAAAFAYLYKVAHGK